MYVENYENLANAIILQALKDYETLIRHLTSKHIDDIGESHTRKEMDKLIKWFHSEHYRSLTLADGDYLLAAQETKFWSKVFKLK